MSSFEHLYEYLEILRWDSLQHILLIYYNFVKKCWPINDNAFVSQIIFPHLLLKKSNFLIIFTSSAS